MSDDLRGCPQGVRHRFSASSEIEVQCWGLNNYGAGSNTYAELGDGTTTIVSPIPVTVSGISRAVAIGVGGSCALLDTGAIECWGYNEGGGLGNDTVINSTVPVPVSQLCPASTGTDGGATGGGVDGGPACFTTELISTGGDHTCAVLSDGSLDCWGRNTSGQLGNGTTVDRLTPTPVTGLSQVQAVSGGGVHTCAVLVDHTVQCWGNNAAGQLGNGTKINSTMPVPVFGSLQAIAVSAGLYHTCAVLDGGSVQCWGYNDHGQLGAGTTATSSAVPVTVPGVTHAIGISAGKCHNCVLLDSGSVQCWGCDSYAQLGNGSAPPNPRPVDSPAPVTISFASWPAVAVSAGTVHSCAVRTGAQVECWGAVSLLGNYDVTRGNQGAVGYSWGPVPVSGLSQTALAMAAANKHTCALLGNGSVECWGENGYGQLGVSWTQGEMPYAGPFSPVSLASPAIAVSVGHAHSCALLTDRSIACWGNNAHGQLGNGTVMGGQTPVIVSAASCGP